MKCSTARELFSAAFDGELSVSEEREFKSHISACRSCTGEFDLFCKSIRLVSSLGKPQVNPFFEARLKHAIIERQTAATSGGRSVPLVLRPAVAFAAVAVLVGLLLLVPPGQVNLNNSLVTSELPSSDLVRDEVSGVPVQPLDASNQGAVPGSYGAGQSSPDTRIAWSTSDARDASSYGSGGTAVPAPGDMASAKDAVLEVEFVLDPFFLQGTEVRRLETASVSGVEPELVSMTF